MSRIRWMVSSLVAVAVALIAMGCASSSDGAPKISGTGAHPGNWLQVHYADFFKSPDQCKTCHGSTTDPASSGGISKVSCFSCHSQAPSHQPGWAAGSQHGRLGALARAGNTSGFAFCAQCHGADFSGGSAPSCKTCHSKAPHPDKPWHGGATVSNPSHVYADASNAAECIKCHLNGANSALKPTSPAPAGSAPGCFNNTMCHSRNI